MSIYISFAFSLRFKAREKKSEAFLFSFFLGLIFLLCYRYAVYIGAHVKPRRCLSPGLFTFKPNVI